MPKGYRKNKKRKNKMKKYLECGTVINTHGVKGALKVYSLCNSPRQLADLPQVYYCVLGEYRKLSTESASVYKDTVIFVFSEIKDMDSALRLKGKTLYADRDDIVLADGEYFLADLIGLDVIDERTGEKYGVVENVNADGAQTLYEIRTENGIKLLPAVDEFIKRIDFEKAVYITPCEGLFEI